jgi:hypothetical protein
MSRHIALALLIVMASCKSKAVLAEKSAEKKMSPEKILENHYANTKDFSTLYIKATAKYEDSKQTQNVSAEIKIKKDEMILVSIRFLGITMAKALITPKEVKYYEKINGQYFEGNYAALSQWLGTDLDFQKVQNMLIGEPFDDLRNKKFTSAITDQLYTLEDDSDKSASKTYYFEAEQFLIKKQQIEQSQQQRALLIFYPNYAATNQILLPTGLVIEADQNKGKTNIKVDYNSVSFNEELSFPYSVPEGYERIFIN